MNSKQIWGLVTITAIVGGTAYCIYQYQRNKGISEEAISAEQAIEEFKKYKAEKDAEAVARGEIVGEYKSHEELEMVMYEQSLEETTATKLFNTNEEEPEDNTLRHEPNSNQALQQYIDMVLAEWHIGDFTRSRMKELFYFPVIPQNDGDDTLAGQLKDYRRSFFGHASKWSEEVSLADVILHYARKMDYNCGGGPRSWVEMFLESSGLDEADTSDEIGHISERIQLHNYYNEAMDEFGLFGLTRYQMEQVHRIAQQTIEGLPTFEMEFNVLLEGHI